MNPKCKICAADTRVLVRVDFNKQGNLPAQHLFPPTGEEVTYWRCTACGFAFTTMFDAFDGAWHAVYKIRPSALGAREFQRVLASIPTGFVPVT